MTRILEGLAFITKDLIHDGWRSAITVINLTVFISCFFCLASLAEAGFKFGSQPVNPSELMVIARNVFDPSESQITNQEFEPMRELMPSPVQSVSPLILRHLNVNGYLLQVRAAPLEDFQSVHSLSLLEGTWPSGINEVVIGEGTVALTHWKPGDTLHIYGVDFSITGVVQAPGTKFGSIWMSLENGEKLFGTPGVYQFAWIVLAPGADAEGVIARLKNDVRLSGQFDVYFADQLYKQYSGALNDIREISLMLVILSLLCVMLGVYGSTYLTLIERSRDLTILRAVGFSSSSIRIVLAMRTLVQVVAAYLLGWLITTFTIQWFEEISPLMIHSIPLPVVISIDILAVGAFLSIVFAGIGVWLPTRHLRRSSVASMIQR